MAKYRAMERYEKEIPDVLKNIYEQEQYREMIYSDLRQLEGERGVVEYEREAAQDKKIFLRNLAFGGGFLVVLLFITLLIMNLATGADMLLPLLLVLCLAAGVTAYIFHHLLLIKQGFRLIEPDFRVFYLLAKQGVHQCTVIARTYAGSGNSFFLNSNRSAGAKSRSKQRS